VSGWPLMYGYTEILCDDCAEIVYRGRFIDNAAQLIAAHDLACAKPLSSMPEQSRLRAFVDRLRSHE